MKKTIVTSSQRATGNAMNLAKSIANQLNLRFVPRNGLSIAAICSTSETDNVLVVTEDQIKWCTKEGGHSFFFHPGLSVVRIKRLLAGDNDIMIDTCQLKPGDIFLDCTLGSAADAIVASFTVGEIGQVIGIESEPILAFLIADGLKKVREFPEIDQAAKRIEVVQGNHLDILRSLPAKSIDVVYFDPMFRTGVKQSDSLGILRGYANLSPLNPIAIQEARRVARRLIVMKERKFSGEFVRLGFSLIKRENTDLAYGVIKIEGEGERGE
jgi:16S rRNA (guanine1516-N2)-methyltransferase